MYLREATKLCVPVDRVFGGVQVSTTICRECYAVRQPLYVALFIMICNHLNLGGPFNFQ